MQSYIKKYITFPEDPENNYWLGWEYEKLGQNAAALSYYLRCAELSTDKDLVYECLLKTWLCVHKSQRRPWYEEQQLIMALTQNPKRPEAYFLLSRVYEGKGDWKKCYYYSSVGLEMCDFNSPKLRTNVDYPGDFSLLFQKAFSSWYIGQREDSKRLWLQVSQDPTLTPHYSDIVQSNLQKLGIDPLESPSTDKIDIILQGPYKPYALETAKHYLNLDFVNNVIISCWQDDDTPNWFPKGIYIVKNSLPKSDGTANRNLQIVSSLGGLKHANTKYAVKMRNDQRYTLDSMEKMYEFFHQHKSLPSDFISTGDKPYNKILTAGMFEGFPFHPRDGIFWGHTKDLIRLFSCPLEPISIHEKANIGKRDYWKYYEHFIRTESYLGSHYCANFNEIINKWLLKPEEYLYDNSPRYNEALELSNVLTKQVFKSFPREGIDLEWKTYGWDTYPYDTQYQKFNERWHEHGY